MGKRTPGQFERKPRDLYPSPPEVVPALLPHLRPRTRFIEPCAGDGRLIGYLQEHGHICEGGFDIAPQDPCIIKADALRLRELGFDYDDLYFITNPPWKRELLHALIVALSDQHPTWLLFDADWMHTKQARPFMRRCRRIASVGRVKWEPDTKHQGKDNAAWYLFTASETDAPPLLHGRLNDDA